MFMTLATLKHGVKFYLMGRMFGMKGPTFERLILHFLSMVLDKAHDIL